MEQIARTSKQIGEAVRRRRKILKLTQQDLGETTGHHQPTISSLEAGEPGTKFRTLFDVLAGLDLELVIRPRTKASSKDIEDIF